MRSIGPPPVPWHCRPAVPSRFPGATVAPATAEQRWRRAGSTATLGKRAPTARRGVQRRPQPRPCARAPTVRFGRLPRPPDPAFLAARAFPPPLEGLNPAAPRVAFSAPSRAGASVPTRRIHGSARGRRTIIHQGLLSLPRSRDGSPGTDSIQVINWPAFPSLPDQPNCVVEARIADTLADPLVHDAPWP